MRSYSGQDSIDYRVILNVYVRENDIRKIKKKTWTEWNSIAFIVRNFGFRVGSGCEEVR